MLPLSLMDQKEPLDHSADQLLSPPPPVLWLRRRRSQALLRWITSPSHPPDKLKPFLFSWALSQVVFLLPLGPSLCAQQAHGLAHSLWARRVCLGPVPEHMSGRTSFSFMLAHRENHSSSTEQLPAPSNWLIQWPAHPQHRDPTAQPLAFHPIGWFAEASCPSIHRLQIAPLHPIWRPRKPILPPIQRSLSLLIPLPGSPHQVHVALHRVDMVTQLGPPRGCSSCLVPIKPSTQSQRSRNQIKLPNRPPDPIPPLNRIWPDPAEPLSKASSSH